MGDGLPCWTQGRSRLSPELGRTGSGDIGEEMVGLLRRGHHRHQRVDRVGARRGLGPNAPLAPEDARPNRPLGGGGAGLPRGADPIVLGSNGARASWTAMWQPRHGLARLSWAEHANVYRKTLYGKSAHVSSLYAKQAIL